MSAITSLNISENLLAPTDADGAIPVRGLHMNTVIDRVNEIAALYLSTPVVNQIKVTDYNYRGATSSAIIKFEDLKQVISKLNSISAPPSIIPLSSQLIKNTDFRTPNDSVEVRKLHLDQIVKSINVVIDKINLTPVQFKIEYDGITQFDFKFKAPIGKTLKIYDGDGTETDVGGNDAVEVTHTTSYATAGTYYFYVEGDYVDMTFIDIRIAYNSGDFGEKTVSPKVSVDVSRWKDLVNIEEIYINDTYAYGDISKWADHLINLKFIFATNTNVSGDVSGFSALPLLAMRIQSTFVEFNSDSLWSGSPGTVYIQNCGMSSKMVDNIIKALSGVTDTKIQIGENNGNRTSDVDTYLETLINQNILISLNETDNLGVLGAELHVGPDAISDPNNNESNSIIGWSEIGLNGTGNNVFSSQQIIVDTGDDAFKLDGNDIPTALAGITKTYPVEISEVYHTSWKMRHLGEGGTWGLYFNGSASGCVAKTPSVEFFNTVMYSKAPDTSHVIYFREVNTVNSGGMYIDNLSIKKVTLP